MKNRLLNRLIGVVLDVEHHLCPAYCGLLDRCQVVAFLFLTLCELCIIPFHLVLFAVLGDGLGLGVCVGYGLLLAGVEYMVWSRRMKLFTGISILYVMVGCKLAVDSVLSFYFGHPDDHLSVPNNIFILFILSYSSLSLRMRRAFALINGLIPLVLLFIFVQVPGCITLFSLKGLFVGYLMNAFVGVTTMDSIRLGLRKTSRMSKEEERALALVAEMKDTSDVHVGSLLGRLSPEVRHRMVHRIANHLRNEDLEQADWEALCPDLTRSEIQICRLVVKGLSLKEICAKLNKTESNITSQRSHIRKKLNMDKQEDLKTTLTKRLLEFGGGGALEVARGDVG